MLKKYCNMPLACITALLTFVLVPLNCFAEDTEEPKQAEEEVAQGPNVNILKISEAFGHLIGKNLESLGFEFDMTHIIKGMQDSISGVDSPMDETECVQAISLVQEDAFQKLAKKNLDQADEFMAKNSVQKDVVELEEGKLQYKIEVEGKGLPVQAHYSPLIKYVGKFLDGKVFGASEEDELISLDETIQGFSKGIVGMKEGEKRTIFIHPELGYGTSGYLPPNSSLVFEIELVKADVPQEQHEALMTVPTQENSEIAFPDIVENQANR